MNYKKKERKRERENKKVKLTLINIFRCWEVVNSTETDFLGKIFK